MQCGWCLRDFDEHELTLKYYIRKPGEKPRALKVCKERCALIVNRSFPTEAPRRNVPRRAKKGSPD